MISRTCELRERANQGLSSAGHRSKRSLSAAAQSPQRAHRVLKSAAGAPKVRLQKWIRNLDMGFVFIFGSSYRVFGVDPDFGSPNTWIRPLCEIAGYDTFAAFRRGVELVEPRRAAPRQMPARVLRQGRPCAAFLLPVTVAAATHSLTPWAGSPFLDRFGF
jgi:hypothetical protein